MVLDDDVVGENYHGNDSCNQSSRFLCVYLATSQENWRVLPNFEDKASTSCHALSYTSVPSTPFLGYKFLWPYFLIWQWLKRPMIIKGVVYFTHSWQQHWHIWRQASPHHCWPCIRSGPPGFAWCLWCLGTPLRPVAPLQKDKEREGSEVKMRGANEQR